MEKQQKVYVLFETDNWHSGSSQSLLGVSKTLKGAIKLAKGYALLLGYKLTQDDLYMLENKLQTQGRGFDGEFYIECVPLNELV